MKPFFILDDFEETPLHNGAIKILVAAEAMKIANAKLQKYLDGCKTVYAHKSSYECTNWGELEPEPGDNYRAVLFNVEEIEK